MTAPPPPAPPEDDYDPATDVAEAEDDGLAPHWTRRSRIWRRLRRLLLLFLVVLSLALLARMLFTVYVVVPDVSMYPAVPQGGELMVLKTGQPEPGDLVLIHLDRGHVVRRMIAGPGGSVSQTRDGLEVNGRPLARQALAPEGYFRTREDQLSVTALTCNAALEQVGTRSVKICVGSASERPSGAISLAANEIYVRCDNRAFCAGRGMPEGAMSLDRVVGRVLFLMSTPDDSDRPFYERWFGRFERVP